MTTDPFHSPDTEPGKISPWLRLDDLCKQARETYRLKGLLGIDHGLERRIASVFREIGRHDEAILWHEGCAILAELRGNIQKAVHHRNCEIDGMRRLHEIVGDRINDPQAAAGVLSDRGQV